MNAFSAPRTVSAESAERAKLAELEAVLERTVTAVKAAGELLRERHDVGARPGDLEEVVGAIHANDEAVLALIKQPLLTARPGSRWVEDELAGGALPAGEWWVVDTAEGNINHVHGMGDWGVTATLVRDNAPVLTVVHLPLTGDTYTAVQGRGALLNGERLRSSAKTDLRAALVGTGQAKPREDEAALRRMGASVTAMLINALVVRVSVPATMQLIHVASGRMDAFWQFSDVRSGLLPGALLVAEAGGSVTDTRGVPWSLTSDDFLASAPGLHTQAVGVLSDLG
ncbi:inositol monophosphatase family protein [Streptomyces antarcticus]|uniref:inositol monophosphatase family protein n=1 Tax=Streptomyces antarcticus TaxID=2996458 RepID=UPI0022709FE7|nr:MULTISPECIES: inositol monophosphatase family protein [unclassified Streptomyces]MCY0944163.1 3'(2'),5'-bisphosphate nucleotidase CysQ [Streptomyces sp. H34-AA3]MCZ4086884.1 3'(2'),5'-bisphosphate nucleotidase CysQ [Streptomyces sp. H34-S5]